MTGRASNEFKQAQAKQDADWLQGFLDKGQLPGTGPMNTPRIRRALESGLLKLSEEEIAQMRMYIDGQ